MRGLTSMVRWRLRSLSVQAESRLRSSSLAAWDLDRTQHVTENYVFTAFQLLLDPDFNSILNQSVKLTEHQERTKHFVQICKCLGSAPQEGSVH
jgi:hypothetical protein